MKLSEVSDKLELYILSLWLLFFLIILITLDFPVCFDPACSFIGWYELLSTNIVPLTAFFMLLLGMFFFFRFDYKISGSSKIPAKIIRIEDLNYEHLTFLTTYIIPLICFNLTSTRYLLALGLLLIIIGIIYVKTDKFYVNPTLAVLGFRLYKVSVLSRTGKKENIVVITKDHLGEHDQVRLLDLDDKVSFGRKVK
ncbi:anti-phage protein KwaA [uncultured Methylophaga sp.]|uniref:anti-phage protein KwaA n=1 Tax=uncultured Methylophaga sp. TaxID=285271 RepID=UPI0026125B08|nr:anti-phage protein KwaA [uncultured Methylophaga sp.]